MQILRTHVVITITETTTLQQYCNVFGDGTVEYVGAEPWQCSCRRLYMGSAEPRRRHHTRLKAADFRRAVSVAKCLQYVGGC